MEEVYVCLYTGGADTVRILCAYPYIGTDALRKFTLGTNNALTWEIRQLVTKAHSILVSGEEGPSKQEKIILQESSSIVKMISDRRFQSPRLQPEKERSIPANNILTDDNDAASPQAAFGPRQHSPGLVSDPASEVDPSTKRCLYFRPIEKGTKA